MARSAKQVYRLTGREAMYSPGAPSLGRGGYLEYRASVAQWKAERFAKRPKPAKLASNARLCQYVRERLEGKVLDAEGREIAGPRQAPFKGRNKPHRGDRKWVNGWSPEQIANRLKTDFPDDDSMRISHEAIYQALYIQGRGALKRDSHRACVARSPGESARQGVGARQRGGDDFQPACRGARSCCARPLGG